MWWGRLNPSSRDISHGAMAPLLKQGLCEAEQADTIGESLSSEAIKFTSLRKVINRAFQPPAV